jgi:hypothetical protein
VPEDHELPDRLRPVLTVVYLVQSPAARRECGPTARSCCSASRTADNGTWR